MEELERYSANGMLHSRPKLCRLEVYPAFYSSTPQQQEAYREALRHSLRTGHDILEKGGEAMDAVVAAVAVMESECWVQNTSEFNSRSVVQTLPK